MLDCCYAGFVGLCCTAANRHLHFMENKYGAQETDGTRMFFSCRRTSCERVPLQ
jgi:hypothetical protein